MVFNFNPINFCSCSHKYILDATGNPFLCFSNWSNNFDGFVSGKHVVDPFLVVEVKFKMNFSSETSWLLQYLRHSFVYA